MKSHPQVMMELIRQYAKERGKSIQAEQFIQHLANRSISYRNYPTPQDMYDTFDNEFGKCACGGCYGQCEESIPELTVPPPAAYVHGFVLQSMQTVLTDMRTGSHQDRGDGSVIIHLDIGTLSRAIALLEQLMKEEAK